MDELAAFLTRPRDGVPLVVHAVQGHRRMAMLARARMRLMHGADTEPATLNLIVRQWHKRMCIWPQMCRWYSRRSAVLTCRRPCPAMETEMRSIDMRAPRSCGLQPKPNQLFTSGSFACLPGREN